MPGGYFFTVMFFALVFFCSIQFLNFHTRTAGFILGRQGYTRSKMAALSGSVIWVVGLTAVFSFNYTNDFEPLSFILLFEDKNMFEVLEFSVPTVFLPVTAFLIAVFAGWVVSHKILREEIGIKSEMAFGLWKFMTRYPAVIGVGCVLVFGLLLN